MKVTCIGSGGAFDTDQPNSSFIVKLKINNDKNYSHILIDCGYNIFSELKNNYIDLLEKIDYVFITHMDDDHIGSLKSLIYYRYFILGKITKIIQPSLYSVLDDLQTYLKDLNKELKGYEYKHTQMFKIVEMNYLDNGVKQIIGVHHTPSSGILIKETYTNSIVVISGDTKATHRFEDVLKTCLNNEGGDKYEDNIKQSIIFHDYSFWNAPSKNTHACESDILSEYSETFRNHLIKYHNSDAKLNGNTWEFDSSNSWTLQQ